MQHDFIKKDVDNFELDHKTLLFGYRAADPLKTHFSAHSSPKGPLKLLKIMG